MSAYLKFFELEQSPFEGRAQSQVVLGTRALRDAFGTIRGGLDEGASRICVSGAAGLGKTSLARALPKLLGDEARVANVLDAGVAWEACRDGIARQWGLGDGRLSRSALVEARADRRLVLVIDQAEHATEDFLDHLDVLLSYRTDHDAPVVQSILLANLAAREGEAPAPLLWWLDRIQTLQLEFAPLPRSGVATYIAKHLRRAGWRGEALFSEEAGFAIHGYAGGVPGEISALCEKLLVEAASQGCTDIDADFVHAVCDPQPEEQAIEPEEEEGVESLEASAAETDTSDDEAPWTVPDEFEALMAEGEFGGAEDPAPPPPADAGIDETAVLACDADEAMGSESDDEDEPSNPLVFSSPDEAIDAETDAATPIGLPDEAPAEEAPMPRNLAAALEFFESAAKGTEGHDGEDAGGEPIELADVVDADPDHADEEEEGSWTFATEDEDDEEGGHPTPDARAEAGMDAASVPEPDAPDAEPFDAPLTDEELAAFAGLARPAGRKPLVMVAIAATVAGLAFLVFGGGDESVSEPSPMVAGREAAAAGPAPVLATPAQGFVDKKALDRLPKEMLAKASARADALAAQQAAERGARTDSGPADARDAAQTAPKPARTALAAPAVTDESSTRDEAGVTYSEQTNREGRLARVPLAKKDPVDRKPARPEARNPQESVPAAPGQVPNSGRNERFW